MALIEFEQIAHSYTPEPQSLADYALKEIDTTWADGGAYALLGPSGCGKTTLLKIIAGIEQPESGSVGFVQTAGERPRVRMVFQEDRLLPWATVIDNLMLAVPAGLRKSGENRRLAEELLEETGLKGAEYKYPGQLSGGMRKRAALARGFMADAEVILLDEPLQAVDWSMKLSLVKTFAGMKKRRPVTAVFVTHDIQEAALMGDVVHVLGSAPMHIRKTFVNPTDEDGRGMYNPGTMDMEKEIFRCLTENESAEKK